MSIVNIHSLFKIVFITDMPLAAAPVDIINDNILNLIKKVEIMKSTILLATIKSIITDEDMEKLYNKMAEPLDDIIELLKETNNVYKFIKENGIKRVINTNMRIKYTKLHIKFIIILKMLLNKAAISTKTNIAYTMVTDMLDMFEDDDNLAVKAHVIDVLNVLLPENPKVQAQVMELKGLETFYHQVAKLDTKVIKTMLDLFNKILKEHIRERDNKKPGNESELEKLKLYQKIGLIEKMSTPTVCNGLLNVFELLWNNSTDKKDILDVFELIKNIKPFCSIIFRHKAKARNLFNKLSDYVNKERNIDSLEKCVNLTDVNLIIGDYIREINGGLLKDEL